MTGLEKYRQVLFSCLNCPEEEKEYFFSHICQSTEADEVESLSYEQLIAVLGTPETVAASRIDQRPAEASLSEVQRIKKSSRRMKRFIILFLTFLVIAVLYFCIWDKKHRGASNEMGPPVFVSSAAEEENTGSEEQTTENGGQTP